MLERLFCNGSDRNLFYSGLASGLIHMFIAVIVVLAAVNGVQNASKITIVYITEGERNEATEVSRSSSVNHSNVISTKPASKKIEKLKAETQETESVVAKTESKPTAVSSETVKTSLAQTGGWHGASVASSGQPIDVKFGDSSGLNFRYRETPIYPFAAKRMNKEGEVLLRLTIDENGKLVSVETIKGAGFGFTEAAIEAAKKSSFFPARRNGVAVKSRALWPVRFKLSGGDDN